MDDVVAFVLLGRDQLVDAVVCDKQFDVRVVLADQVLGDFLRPQAESASTDDQYIDTGWKTARADN